MDLKHQLHDQQIYFPNDPAILKTQVQAQLPMYEYNRTLPTEGAKRQQLLKKMLGRVGKDCFLEPPFHANWGGRHVMLGDGVYANFNLTVVDDTYVYIGDRTMMGPNVTLASANHPILPELRRQGAQYNLPIHIGKNCWLGAGVIVVPGVTIGDNTVVGAGAVVTKDLPANVVAVGIPARVQRPINDHDRKYYHGQRKIDPKLLS
ncbi:sugar O-acetyltransferase [Limosilactobacillus sp.]|jgi:galactoside O-acetyltransferase|uniref:sugar O-acetyltransferase n=1 Tax=Limosilactobacillus sp. TaxID=2773925 RepID=UPI0035A14E76